MHAKNHIRVHTSLESVTPSHPHMHGMQSYDQMVTTYCMPMSPVCMMTHSIYVLHAHVHDDSLCLPLNAIAFTSDICWILSPTPPPVDDLVQLVLCRARVSWKKVWLVRYQHSVECAVVTYALVRWVERVPQLMMSMHSMSLRPYVPPCTSTRLLCMRESHITCHVPYAWDSQSCTHWKCKLY